MTELKGVCEECYYAEDTAIKNLISCHQTVAAGDGSELAEERTRDWWCEHFMPRSPKENTCGACYFLHREEPDYCKLNGSKWHDFPGHGCASFMLNRHRPKPTGIVAHLLELMEAPNFKAGTARIEMMCDSLDEALGGQEAVFEWLAQRNVHCRRISADEQDQYLMVYEEKTPDDA